MSMGTHIHNWFGLLQKRLYHTYDSKVDCMLAIVTIQYALRTQLVTDCKAHYVTESVCHCAN